MMTFLQKRSSSAHSTETRRWVTNGQWQRVSKVLTGNSKASFSVSRRSGTRYCKVAIRCRSDFDIQMRSNCGHIMCTSQSYKLAPPDKDICKFTFMKNDSEQLVQVLVVLCAWLGR